MQLMELLKVRSSRRPDEELSGQGLTRLPELCLGDLEMQFSVHRLIGYLRLDARLGPGQARIEVLGGVALSSAARGWLAWLSHGVRIAGHGDEVRLKWGLPSSK